MLVDDSGWRAVHDAAVLASEMAFGMDGREPVRLEIPGGIIALRGKADKVDRTRTGTLLVTDIKTGSDGAFRKITNDPVVAGTKLQLPVYAYAARQRFGGSTAKAQYWFVRRKSSSIPLTLDDELDRTYRATLGVLVASIAGGLFPAKPPKSPDYLWVQCAFCNPDSMGYGDLPDQWRRKQTDALLTELVSLIDPPNPQAVQP
jgi:ATP-dependent helicase/nuclease subunit B